MKVPRRGAYKKRGKPKTKLSIVAFIDFLGFESKIREADKAGRTQQLLNRINKFVRNWRGALIDRYSFDNRRSWEVEFFTDNIVIGYPIDDLTNPESELSHVINQLSLLQIGSVEERFFVRGGIASGQFYMDENVVFGIPLLDAYKAECKEANTPRVILHESTVSSVKKDLREMHNLRDSRYYRDLLQDEEGRFFLNYLQASYTSSGEPPEHDWIEQHHESTCAALRDYEEYRKKYE